MNLHGENGGNLSEKFKSDCSFSTFYKSDGHSTMNKMKDGIEGVAIIPEADIRVACELILASEMFLNSPRASRLLRFLIEKAISGAVQDTSEYAIGIEVFDRKASTYNTSEDPIVRVQIGRLREKLKTYYATLGINASLEISISMGDYMPAIRRRGATKTISRISPCLPSTRSGAFRIGATASFSHRVYRTNLPISYLRRLGK